VEKLIHYAGNFLSNRSNFSFEVQIKKSPPLSLHAREVAFFFVCKRISGLSRRSAAAAARLQNGNDINHNNIVSPLQPKEEDSSGEDKNERKRSLDRNHFYFP
jgi:hypothetical protein